MTLKFTAALVGATLFAAPALAWTDAPLQPAGSPILKHPYQTTNYCPSDLQPITVGGVICCGVPNTAETYYNHPGYRTTPAGPYISTGKGYGEGYYSN